MTGSLQHAIHLRRVHLGLTLLSFGFVVILSNEAPSDAARAHKQIRDIISLIRDFENARWFERFVEQQLDSMRSSGREIMEPRWYEVRKKSWPRGMLGARSVTRKARIVLHLEKRWILPPGAFPCVREQVVISESGEIFVRRPVTLGDFEELWKDFKVRDYIFVATRISGACTLLNSIGDEITRLDYSRIQEVNESDYVIPLRLIDLCQLGQLRTRLGKAENVSSIEEIKYAYVSWGMHGEIVIPVDAELVKLDIQRHLLHSVGSDSSPGEFSESFPELDQATVNLKTGSLAELERHLQREMRRAGAHFEAFGLTFSLEVMNPWGICLVLTSQLYFWLHLRELLYRLKKVMLPSQDSVWDAPWIALYVDWRARGAFVLSAVILPFWACAWVVISMIQIEIEMEILSNETIVGCAVVLLSGVISYGTHRVQKAILIRCPKSRMGWRGKQKK